MPSLLPARPRFTGRKTTDVPSLTHALIGSHVQFLTPHPADNGVPGDLLERMYAVAYAVIDANPNATRVLATEAVGLALGYLTALVPVPPLRLLGVEYDTGHGRVDLAWTHDSDGRVFYDELKTSRVYNPRSINPAWARQAARYAEAGTTRFGDLFQGTRLVVLNATGDVRLFRHRRPSVLLAATPAAPLQPQDTRTGNGRGVDR